jgi:Uma2 family endonuclease
MLALNHVDPDPRADQRVFLRGLTWSDFEAVLAARGDRAGPRIAYLEGVLEIMSPSRFHEEIKKSLARLFEAWADERQLPIQGRGSMTMRTAPEQRAAEPDECYILGDLPKEFADIVLEVSWTSGGLDKLEIYRGLRIREVWMWEDGALHVHVLRGDGYVASERSELLPDLDLALLAKHALEHDNQSRAVWAYRAALRG